MPPTRFAGRPGAAGRRGPPPWIAAAQLSRCHATPRITRWSSTPGPARRHAAPQVAPRCRATQVIMSRGPPRAAAWCGTPKITCACGAPRTGGWCGERAGASRRRILPRTAPATRGRLGWPRAGLDVRPPATPRRAPVPIARRGRVPGLAEPGWLGWPAPGIPASARRLSRLGITRVPAAPPSIGIPGLPVTAPRRAGGGTVRRIGLIVPLRVPAPATPAEQATAQAAALAGWFLVRRLVRGAAPGRALAVVGQQAPAAVRHLAASRPLLGLPVDAAPRGAATGGATFFPVRHDGAGNNPVPALAPGAIRVRCARILLGRADGESASRRLGG